MIFARRIFLIAGIYGLMILMPLYFLEGRIGRDQPPVITHPEYFYGFIGVAVSWQVAFLIISRDPGRFRPLMISCILEKATYAIAVISLFATGRLPGQMLVFGLIDLAIGVLFVIAFVRTPGSSVTPS
jgi:hypothetical protein